MYLGFQLIGMEFSHSPSKGKETKKKREKLKKRKERKRNDKWKESKAKKKLPSANTSGMTASLVLDL